jgi:peptide/nickel transport system permease protein
MSCYSATGFPDIRRRLGSRWGRVVLGGLLLLVALPSLLPLDPYRVDLESILAAPSAAHWLGTDETGRDLLARLLLGARATLGIGLAATVLAIALGTLVGALAGYRGGVTDAVLMRLVDFGLAFPSLFAVLLVASVVPPGPVPLVLVIGVTNWMAAARLVRASVRQLRSAAYTEAARALGASAGRLIRRHHLPNLAGILVVIGLVQFSRSILAEATISFLGFGVQPPAPTWGNLLMGAQTAVFTAPWLAIAPGLAITLTLIALASLGIGTAPARLPRLAAEEGHHTHAASPRSAPPPASHPVGARAKVEGPRSHQPAEPPGRPALPSRS